MLSKLEKYDEGSNLEYGLEITNHLKNKIQILISQLRLERFKSRLYHNLIKQNTSINIDDILTEEEDGIHVYNIKDGNIQVFIHDCIKNEHGLIFTHISKPIEVSILKPTEESRSRNKSRTPKRDSVIDKPKKKMYRSIKMAIDIIEEPTDEERTEHIKSVDNMIFNKQKDIVKNSEVVSVDFKKFFESLKNTKTYPKIMDEIKQNRINMFGKLDLSDYKKLVLEHVEIIEEIFKEKKYTVKKITTIISKGLSALENRLISYGDYTNTHIEIDEIMKIGVVLDVYSKPEKEYIPYDTQNIYNLFYNYGTVLFPIKQNIERYFFNRYGFNNIIYLPLPKNTEHDPYSFYTLESVKDKKRCWKMDCRLEDLSSNIIANILPYIISMFRKIYKDVFNYNEFRKDFLKRSQITECECEQLLQNIQLLSHQQEFSKYLRKWVKTISTFTPSENDKFNICSDDSLQRKRFAEKEDIDMVDIIKQLFDGISSEDAVDFIRTR